ncbi:HK97 gp10 family phage protein [Clostridioides mangenotii]|uniref:HK97 gp10 family phage protein n=1 Tax=Metaclostridioides mangenotii TaxID=1540 RepID=UPI002149C9AB|nr:HK97 gp10 family phage protein [Clostridioides mangenotii]MCR1953795.1 HK97 gp10 family phage protein [Clostridioides mangenotii]
MSNNLDIRQLKRVRDKLQRSTADIDILCRDIAKRLTASLLGMAIRRTPVDTGFLRQSWNTRDYVIRKIGSVYHVEIINSALYASYQEYGHRKRGGKGWMPGRFMLTISEKQLKKLAPSIIEKKVNDYLRECFK